VETFAKKAIKEDRPLIVIGGFQRGEFSEENLKLAGSGGSTVYARINNWETLMTNDDLEAIVHEGLSGVCLAKCGGPDHVQRLDWKLEELEKPTAEDSRQVFCDRSP
jgi:citrate lyase beta subunit